MDEDYNMREFNLLEVSSDVVTIDSNKEDFLESEFNQSPSFCLPFSLPEKIRSRARRVAWYSPSANPFGKRSDTWATPPIVQDQSIDLENQPVHNFGRTLSEPPLQARDFQGSGDAVSPTTPTRQSDARGTGREVGNSSEETAVEGQSAGQSVGEQPLRKRKNDSNSEKTKTSTGFTLNLIKSNKSLKHKPFTLRNQLRNTIFNSWINILLLAAPLGIGLDYVPNISPWAVFFVNFAAIIPLAALLSYGTEEIALRVGETLGGLLNATFGYATLSLSWDLSI
jgi:Ca2+:H+ antiporter